MNQAIENPGTNSDYADDLLPSIRSAFLQSGKTIVVLDDDPTGTQTSYDVPVLLKWSVHLLTDALNRKPDILFILTNSRSLNEKAAVTLAKEVGENLKEAVRITGREIIPISRSDSTLRGHFPAEVEALAETLDMEDATWIVLPAFIEGARYTRDDVHYIVEDGRWIPVAETPFAKDAAFGYKHADLKAWVEEKTKGRVKASSVISFSLEEIRTGRPEGICKKLLATRPGEIGIVNACTYNDIEVFVMGILLAEEAGKRFIFRSSATLVPIRAGLHSGKQFELPQARTTAHGALLVVGSYVPKTTSQLHYFLENTSAKSIEVNVDMVLEPGNQEEYLKKIVKDINQWLADNEDIVLYTSRKLLQGNDPSASLEINRKVSGFLTDVVKGLTVRPEFIIAKGGITSNDLASKGLGAERADVLGQIIPGVPVWRMDTSCKFPSITYVVFPGNVGDEPALVTVFNRLKGVEQV